MSESDLVERLRAASHDERLSTGMLYREAADEIERLRAELADVRDQAARLIRDLDAASRERERLRAELAAKHYALTHAECEVKVLRAERDALEEAAKVCDDIYIFSEAGEDRIAERCAAAIRALKNA